MATIQVNNLISRASTLVQDTTNVRWPTTEFLDWLNDGQREVVLYKPEASVKNTNFALTSGATKHTLPADGILLVDVTRNMGAGSTPGYPVRITTREVLDAQKPLWHSDTNTVGYVQHYIYDPRDPKTFYVYPKAPATWYVELIYSAAPTDCTLGGTIQIDDIYANALLDYMLYRAYSKDAEYAANGGLAVAHYQAFTNALGVKSQGEASRNPNTTISNMAYNPTVPSASTGASTGK